MNLIMISHAVICIAYAGAFVGLDKQTVSAVVALAYAVIVWNDWFRRH
ncbi:hypothetical protein [Pseudodonghicola flavimaris]|uniref:Uncharacterized protein n=1 Tax=Pseudodonghicola flavimaris TaxID=3050036 RepID=A0ABT7F703_9RHOB|nr:hypothetical protein [Pseudodonghicola flavimaris]MDK3020396.1 hypothetical protein [Pseudodonghicola flavimaris]